MHRLARNVVHCENVLNSARLRNLFVWLLRTDRPFFSSRSLPLQRLRPVLENERHESATDSAAEENADLEASRPQLLELSDQHNDPLAPELSGRAGVQRLRPLLQASWG